MHSSQLIRLIQHLSTCRDVPAIMQVLRQGARALTGADGITVVLREGELCHYAEEDAIEPLWKGRRFPISSCISGWCMVHGEQLAVFDIYEDPRVLHEAYRPTFVKSLAMTPIRKHDPIGAIGAYWATPHRASPEELEILQALGDSAAVAFANARLIDSLEVANRNKDEFLSMLAHELRNPLAPIRNALHVLRADDSQVSHRTREMMERQVGHLTRIVDDLLDVARITRGSIELQCERLDLARLVRETFEDRRRLLEEASLEPRLDVHESTIWVMGDHTRLTQAIANVLDNAAKFTPAGGKVTVRLLMDEHEREALLVVHDSGIGIAPEVLPRVFDVFAQADRSLARTRGGLGLGLTVARSIIELHGGTIEAASEGEGRGAKFVIRFPALVESPALAKQLATSPATHRLRVLIIEDNRDSAEMLRLLLEAAGHEVAVAHTGPDGVNAAHAFEPHVVVCDIGLPGMDGFEVAETLRQDPAMASARLLAVTGYGSEADRLRTVRAGFDAHLVKPVDPEALLAQLALGARALVTS